MGEVVRNVALVLVFILIGGFFAGAEMALVSLREGQVKSLSTRGRRGQSVSRLASDPNRFLSAVQIGVTLAGFLSAAFGAATLAEDVAPLLTWLGLPGPVADTLALVVITLLIAYFSLVLGELAPKRIALQRAEGLSLAVAPALDFIARLSRPVIWLLSISTNAVVRMLGGDPRADREQMTEEELRELLIGHQGLPWDERRIIERVFAAGDRPVREVLVPRTEVEFVSADTTLEAAARFATSAPYSRFPVYRRSYDDIIGFVHVRDLLDPELTGRKLPVLTVTRPLVFLPDSKRVLAALTDMRGEGHHLAIVLDEYGGTAGIVTLEDLVEELVGDIRDEYDIGDAEPTRLAGGVVEVDGLLNLDDFEDASGLRLPEGPYETVGGYVMATLGHVPSQNEAVDIGGRRLTVAEMDGRRVARVRVSPLPSAEPRAAAEGDAVREDSGRDDTVREDSVGTA
ncbi:MAG: DUF21 domain-containing protein [Streptosporangiales bacterium]|nr:DUF21 domain-containing protein [Streptosporangiales bacterium]